VFAIADFNELDSVIKSSGLEGYFQASGGDYSKMDKFLILIQLLNVMI
jgi:hypothetical protein